MLETKAQAFGGATRVSAEKRRQEEKKRSMLRKTELVVSKVSMNRSRRLPKVTLARSYASDLPVCSLRLMCCNGELTGVDNRGVPVTI